jgi:hypothetical protein
VDEGILTVLGQSQFRWRNPTAKGLHERDEAAHGMRTECIRFLDIETEARTEYHAASLLEYGTAASDLLYFDG